MWVDAPCAADQRCTDTLGCVACDPSGAFTCVGGHAHRCGADGTVGAFVTTCRAAACVEGAGCANDDPHPAPNPRAECGVPAGELDSRPVCDERAPPDSFEHDVQWAWTAPDGYRYSHVTPLVGNLTDDNDDGFIDLCDTPDILVHAYRLDPETLAPDMDRGRLHVLDGATGQHHYTIEGPFDEITPALGDIDDDGRIEIVAVRDRHLAAFENDGAPKWTSEVPVESYQSSIALGDVDNDGDVEIAIDAQLFDHTGALLWAAEASPIASATVLADLDDDGDLEVIVGERAFHHDGSVYFGLSLDYGYPQIANFDDDPAPEILLTTRLGIALVEHDGTIVYEQRRPGNPLTVWRTPAAIHDFDGDGHREFAMNSQSTYGVFERDATLAWSAEVVDFSGAAAGTAFDFLGDGTPEAIYGDEADFYIFDDEGRVVYQAPRTSRTLVEYPVVADVDNDGAAEIVLVSDDGWESTGDAPTVQVLRDREERWVQARRIWNQHTYHVTNVREDGTIPRWEQPWWRLNNTFRINTPIDDGLVCEPGPI